VYLAVHLTNITPQAVILALSFPFIVQFSLSHKSVGIVIKFQSKVSELLIV
jgi:hypothetical protein